MTKQTIRTVRSNGFTLVELLVVISIIGFMSGMFLVAYRGAQQESDRTKSISTITKISEILNSRMEEYSSYPVTYVSPIPSSAIPIVPAASGGDSVIKLYERARLLSLRDVIRTEMPDHPDDIKWTTGWLTTLGFTTPSSTMLDPIPAIATGLATASSNVYVKAQHTSRSTRLMQRLSRVVGGGYAPIPGWETTNANAELLFLIVEDSSLNGTSAIEMFGKSEIGDTDGDGLSEFLDAERNPIQWLRWPAGFTGVAAFHPDLMDPSLTPSNIASDPLDRMGADPGYSPFAPSPQADYRPKAGMFPLVVSPGSDKIFGLRFQLGSPNNGSYSVADCPSWTSFYGTLSLQHTDPWYPRNDITQRLGSQINAAAARDDLTNYDGNGASL
jgi:prepilin-type N-terminal cleavage/methylation domain-containing protein